MTNADKGNIEVINGSIGDLIFRIETLTSDRDTIKVCVRAADELTAMEKKIQHLTAFNESMQTDARKNTETIRELKEIAANLARHLESINHIAERGANIAPRMTKEIRKHCEAANVMEAL